MDDSFMRPADWLGALGVTLLLSAFVLQLLRRISADGVAYSLLNVLGAGIAGYASWRIDFMPFVVLEGVWCLAATVALVTALRRARRLASVDHSTG